MFVFQQLSRLFLGSNESATDAVPLEDNENSKRRVDLLELPSGSLYELTGPSNDVCHREIIYGLSSLLLRRRTKSTSSGDHYVAIPFEYELVVTNQILTADDAAAAEEEEQPTSTMVFRLSRETKFERHIDLEGNSEFYFTFNKKRHVFVVDGHLVLMAYASTSSASGTSEKTQTALVEMFHLLMAQCLFESVHRVVHESASESELSEFVTVVEAKDHEDYNAVIQSVPVSKLTTERMLSNFETTKDQALRMYRHDVATHLFVSLHPCPVRAVLYRKSSSSSTNARIARSDESQGWRLRVFCCRTGATVHSQAMGTDATVCCDRANKSFVWCCASRDDERIDTFSLRFSNTDALSVWNSHWARIVLFLRQAPNTSDSHRMTEEEQEQLFRTQSGDVIMWDLSDAANLPDSDSDLDSDSEEEEEEEEEVVVNQRLARGGALQQRLNKKIRQMAASQCSDRVFVSREGSGGVDVFKSDAYGDVELAAVIDGLKSLKTGSMLNPSAFMLHQADRSLLLMDPTAGNQRIFRMDVERGSIVEEWDVAGGRNQSTSLKMLLPETKYAQRTSKETLIGVDVDSIFRIDPRLAGSKRVSAASRQYASLVEGRSGFTCAATTGSGHVAIASETGELRLLDGAIGPKSKARNLLAGFGDPIIGLDVAEGGKYMVATCRSYLLFYCTSGTNTAVNAFERTIPVGQRSDPIKLQLKPEHVAYMRTEMSSTSPINFTPAHFNTGEGLEERFIVTSTGPFVIKWSVRRIKLGHYYDYTIRRYDSTVVADSFKYGDDRNIVVALPEEVTVLSQRSMKSPSLDSLRS